MVFKPNQSVPVHLCDLMSDSPQVLSVQYLVEEFNQKTLPFCCLIKVCATDLSFSSFFQPWVLFWEGETCHKLLSFSKYAFTHAIQMEPDCFSRAQRFLKMKALFQSWISFTPRPPDLGWQINCQLILAPLAGPSLPFQKKALHNRSILLITFWGRMKFLHQKFCMLNRTDWFNSNPPA